MPSGCWRILLHNLYYVKFCMGYAIPSSHYLFLVLATENLLGRKIRFPFHFRCKLRKFAPEIVLQ